mgnify:CR=1 FL=1|tara:strand:+ start:1650 stop:1832 length:183 start_codon:yes stop_codon:yes gene_type:complete
MGKEFYSDAIKLMKSFARGNQSSRRVVGATSRSSKGRMRGKGLAVGRRPVPSPPVPPRRP